MLLALSDPVIAYLAGKLLSRRHSIAAFAKPDWREFDKEISPRTSKPLQKPKRRNEFQSPCSQARWLKKPFTVLDQRSSVTEFEPRLRPLCCVLWKRLPSCEFQSRYSSKIYSHIKKRRVWRPIIPRVTLVAMIIPPLQGFIVIVIYYHDLFNIDREQVLMHSKPITCKATQAIMRSLFQGHSPQSTDLGGGW